MPIADGPRPAPAAWRFGVFELDLESRELRRQGRRVRLQNQPFEVLILLVERAGKLVGREELRQRLWPHGTFVDFEQGLNAAVRKLRGALDDDAQNPRFIETAAGHGYRFIAPVERIETAPKGKSASFVAPARTTVILPGREPWRRKLRWRVLVGGGVALALAFGLGVGAWVARREPRAWAPSRIESLAVLPLADLSGSRESAVAARRLTEGITDRLRGVTGLRVVPSESSKSPNTDGLLEGSVTLVGDQVRVSLRLVDATSDRGLWARRYEGRSANLAGLEGQILRDLTAQLRSPL